jgi:excisionase family DNA binding protein
MAGKPKLEALTYTVDEGAQVMGISRAYLYELIKEGVVPALLLGRRVLLSKSAVHHWVETGRWPGQEAVS